MLTQCRINLLIQKPQLIFCLCGLTKAYFNLVGYLKYLILFRTKQMINLDRNVKPQCWAVYHVGKYLWPC